MDDEPIFRTRRVKPMLAISTTMTIKRWVEAQARERETSQAKIVNTILLREMARTDETDDEDELAVMSA